MYVCVSVCVCMYACVHCFDVLCILHLVGCFWNVVTEMPFKMWIIPQPELTRLHCLASYMQLLTY